MSERIVVGKLKSNLKAARSRSVVIEMAPSVSGYESVGDTSGAIEVVHTISPELKQRLDEAGTGVRSLGGAVRLGLIILAIVIALAIGAALVYASMQMNRLSARAGRTSPARVRRRTKSARGRRAAA